MTTKQTPGPWYKSRAENGLSVICHRNSDGDERVIARLSSRQEIGDEVADADLISAAPELLEALQVAVEAMEQDWYQIDGEWGPTMEEFGDLEGAILAGKAPEIAKARAAIAKATGEAQ